MSVLSRTLPGAQASNRNGLENLYRQAANRGAGGVDLAAADERPGAAVPCRRAAARRRYEWKPGGGGLRLVDVV
ncbi:hypothetical protein [Streptomyces sp. NPDC058545]|uniref:hypothetical protein n=1 Tax=Streptomyces sp. NPDC058545 TaxID=3346544 RepID=UPI003650C449